MFKGFKKNDKYLTIAIYAFLVIAASIGLIWLMQYFGAIASWIGGVIYAMLSFIYGFIIAYICNPIYKKLHKYVFRFFDRKKPHPKLRKTFSIILTYIIFIAIIAAMLLAIECAVILGVRMLFGIMLIPVTLILVGLIILGVKLGVNWVRFVAELIIVVLAIAMIAYGVSSFVHADLTLNPGLGGHVEQKPDPCEKGHSYTDGKCTVCQAADPNYKAPVQDPCEKGHSYTDGKCTVCQAADPNYKAPAQDPCEKGHSYTDGKCTVCKAIDPNYVAPTIVAPDVMKYGKPVTISLKGIDADNLKYGGEDFISIVKVSDTQVVLTLVGIVNDAGQVQIVPASGYITITDTVSGTNTSIRIVE